MRKCATSWEEYFIDSYKSAAAFAGCEKLNPGMQCIRKEGLAAAWNTLNVKLLAVLTGLNQS